MINVRKIFGMSKENPSIDWKSLESEEALQQAISESSEHPVVIFKHSTSCSISSMAKSRLESGWNSEEVNDARPYYLDLLSNRNISNLVAQTLGVVHESPQILILKDGKCVYNTSHMGISFEGVKRQFS